MQELPSDNTGCLRHTAIAWQVSGLSPSVHLHGLSPECSPCFSLHKRHHECLFNADSRPPFQEVRVGPGVCFFKKHPADSKIDGLRITLGEVLE